MHLRSITKSFGPTRALDEVSLDIEPGEVLALVGENGAGKTTLMRIAARELQPDAGTVERNGRVELVHQHFMLVGELTIAENLALSHGDGFRFATRRTLEREAIETIEASGIALGDVSRLVSALSVGEKSKLELIKAIARAPRTLILDEPTSVLTPHESEELFNVLRTLASRGTAIVFISHKLPEVFAVASRVVVMRGGRVVATKQAAEATPHELANAMMMGTLAADTTNDSRSPLQEGARAGNSRPFDPLSPLQRGEGGHASAWPGEGRRTHEDSRPPVLQLERVSGATLDAVDLELRAGEIVAIVGVAGNGQSELAAMLRGLARPRAGRLTIHASHTGHIPEDRTRDGIVAPMTIAENLALGGAQWHPRAAARHARRMIELYSIRAHGPQQRAGDLSGGNQQKLLLARELDPRPGLVVAAEPTRGLDLESTRFVQDQLRATASAGSAVLLITSDLDEAFRLGDAVQVLYRGRLSRRLDRSEVPLLVGDLMAGVA